MCLQILFLSLHCFALYHKETAFTTTPTPVGQLPTVFNGRHWQDSGAGGSEKSGYFSFSFSAFHQFHLHSGSSQASSHQVTFALGSRHTAPDRGEGFSADMNPWAALQETPRRVCTVCSNLYLLHHLSL